MDSNVKLMQLTLEYRSRVFAYVYARVPNRAAAEDLVQETFLTACEKFEDFKEGTDFFSWVRKIAYFKIKHFQRTFARSRVLFDDRLFEKLEATSIEIEEELSGYGGAMEICLGRLKDRDRKMIEVRYASDGGVQEAAEVCGRSLQATYKALHRVREMLQLCVQKKMEATR